jgi:Zn-dependent peptidase ImmA (M78 family)
MVKDNTIILDEKQIYDVKRLALETRQSFGTLQNVPIGSDIRLLLEKQDILLCEYPYPDTDGTHTYGNITWFKTDKETLTFIGLNTSSYYDEQIFAIAHELYHYITKTGKAYVPDMEYEDNLTEKQADRFAAELLLPAEALKAIVVDSFYSSDMFSISDNKVLRFIARLQCDWWLPYKSIVNRLLEENMINSKQYEGLYDIDCRSIESVYRRILNNTDAEISELLNKKTKSIGISNKVIETIISNYEDGIIDEDEFIETLALFDKKPEDYGFETTIEIDDDLKELMESGDDE